MTITNIYSAEQINAMNAEFEKRISALESRLNELNSFKYLKDTFDSSVNPLTYYESYNPVEAEKRLNAGSTHDEEWRIYYDSHLANKKNYMNKLYWGQEIGHTKGTREYSSFKFSFGEGIGYLAEIFSRLAKEGWTIEDAIKENLDRENWNMITLRLSRKKNDR